MVDLFGLPTEVAPAVPTVAGPFVATVCGPEDFPSGMTTGFGLILLCEACFSSFVCFLSLLPSFWTVSLACQLSRPLEIDFVLSCELSEVWTSLEPSESCVRVLEVATRESCDGDQTV